MKADKKQILNLLLTWAAESDKMFASEEKMEKKYEKAAQVIDVVAAKLEKYSEEERADQNCSVKIKEELLVELGSVLKGCNCSELCELQDLIESVQTEDDESVLETINFLFNSFIAASLLKEGDKICDFVNREVSEAVDLDASDDKFFEKLGKLLEGKSQKEINGIIAVLEKLRKDEYFTLITVKAIRKYMENKAKGE